MPVRNINGTGKLASRGGIGSGSGLPRCVRVLLRKEDCRRWSLRAKKPGGRFAHLS